MIFTGTPDPILGYARTPNEGTRAERAWEQRAKPHLGLHWHDMPGTGKLDKKINFFLFRRYLLPTESVAILSMPPRLRDLYLAKHARALAEHPEWAPSDFIGWSSRNIHHQAARAARAKAFADSDSGPGY